MANIDPIRKQIELILEQSFGTQYVEKCATKEYPERYKVILTPLLEDLNRTQMRMIKDLPHVLNIRSLPNKTDTTIYFDCNPKLIQI